MHSQKPKKPRHLDYDLIVIGSGPAGNVAANMSARAGKKVAVIEADTIGGECPNFGCVPTKALLTAAETYRVAKREAAHFGVRATGVSFNFQKIMQWKDEAVYNTGTHAGKKLYKDAGIASIKGKAHFLSPWTVSVGKKRYSAHKFLIATGTYNVVPRSIEGLADAGYITYREAISLKKLPTSLFVIGGGAIGCEFSQFFATFGTKVQIAEYAPRLAPKEDPEVGQTMRAVFESEGIQVHTSTQVTKVVARKGKKEVHYTLDGEQKKTIVQEVLLAAGKGAMTDIGLENAGVKYDARSIHANKYMQTSNPHIYVAGDVTGPYMFTHTATYQSRLVGHNLWHRKKIAADYHAIPRCIFISPEAASVGPSEQELKDKGIDYQVSQVPISIIGRSNTSHKKTGFVKVLASHTGVVLGGSIVAPRAGEMLHELTLAAQHGMKASQINDTIHAFPTWSEAVRIACSRIKCT